MKKKAKGNVLVSLLTIAFGLYILAKLSAFIAIAGGIGLWYFSKKKPNDTYRMFSFIALICGVVSGIFLTPYISSSKNDSTVQNKIESPISSTMPVASLEKETKPSTDENKKSEEQKQKEAEKAEKELLISEGEKAVQNLENNQTLENVQPAQEAIDKISDDKQKATFQNRIEAVKESIAQRAEEERVAAEQEAQRQAEMANQQAANQTAYYPNCSAARAAGAAPVYQGQPGYGRHLDRDGDGVGCER